MITFHCLHHVTTFTFETPAAGFCIGWMGGVNSAASAVKYIDQTEGKADYVVRGVMKSVFVIEANLVPWFDGNLRFAAKLFLME